jgi:hypothetical protein
MGDHGFPNDSPLRIRSMNLLSFLNFFKRGLLFTLQMNFNNSLQWSNRVLPNRTMRVNMQAFVFGCNIVYYLGGVMEAKEEC